MLRIRSGRREDHDTVMGLWQEAGLGAAREDEWRAITSGGPTRLLVADEDGTVCGSVIAAYDGWRAFVYHVAVAGEHRLSGIATALLTEAEGDVRSRGAERVFALVHQSQTDGLALCAANGYEIEGDLAFVKPLS
jgi:ribosomal protein S18 acetylase RimI-like enzyme